MAGDEDFAAAFGSGPTGLVPSRLALVTVLQRAENLTDRQAAESVRTRIDWQYLLGLRLDDAGFAHTVLAEFRARVAGVGLEQVVLDALLERLVSEGLVKAGGKQRTDSPHWSRRWRRCTGWSWPAEACGPRWRRWSRRTRPGWSSGSA